MTVENKSSETIYAYIYIVILILVDDKVINSFFCRKFKWSLTFNNLEALR